MDKLTLFNYDENQIRTFTDEDNAVWFVGIDVCSILGYTDAHQKIKTLDEDEYRLDRIRDGQGKKKQTLTVNEFGLYSLILTSTKPEAKAFKRWVTHDVLPAIRKAGKYTSQEQAEKDRNLRKLHNKITNLEIRRSELNNELKETRQNSWIFSIPIPTS